MPLPGYRPTERTVIVTPDGIEYSLDGSGNRYILVDGEYGMPPIDYVTQRGPFQHGDSVLSAWLRPRSIQLTLRFKGCSRSEYWDHRQELLNMLRFNRSTNLYSSQHKLSKYLANGNRREILVVPDSAPVLGGVEAGKWDAWGFTDVLRFIANDPTWYDPIVKSAVFTTPLYPAAVDFPASITNNPGDYVVTAVPVVRGDWISYPVIVFTGPINAPAIYNESTGDLLALSTHVASGKTLTIDLRYGYKTVVNSDGVNKIADLSDDSNLIGFHMAPAPEVADGINALNVHGTGQSGATGVSVTWFDRFIGI